MIEKQTGPVSFLVKLTDGRFIVIKIKCKKHTVGVEMESKNLILIWFTIFTSGRACTISDFQEFRDTKSRI